MVTKISFMELLCILQSNMTESKEKEKLCISLLAWSSYINIFISNIAHFNVFNRYKNCQFYRKMNFDFWVMLLLHVIRALSKLKTKADLWVKFFIWTKHLSTWPNPAHTSPTECFAYKVCSDLDLLYQILDQRSRSYKTFKKFYCLILYH